MGPSIVRVALAFSLAAAPGEAGAPSPASVGVRTSPVPEAPPQALQSVSYAPPAATWIAAGLAVGLFATGLAFTLTASSISQQAGNLNANGVDIGITRAQAVQGLDDVRIGNTLLVGAGLALIAAVTFAVIHAKNLSESVAAPTANQPLALKWNLP